MKNTSSPGWSYHPRLEVLSPDLARAPPADPLVAGRATTRDQRLPSSPGWSHHPRLELAAINTPCASPGRATTREQSCCRDAEHHHRTQQDAAAPSSPEPTPSAQTSPLSSPSTPLSSLPGGYGSLPLPLPPLRHAHKVFVVMPQPPCGLFFLVLARVSYQQWLVLVSQGQWLGCQGQQLASISSQGQGLGSQGQGQWLGCQQLGLVARLLGVVTRYVLRFRVSALTRNRNT